MTLSVLIPVYQQDVRGLVNELYRQLIQTKVSFEICCLDDFSTESVRKLNRNLLQEVKPEIRYSELTQNIGRSAIRNQLADEALGEFLWFLDCDADARVNPNLVPCFVDQMKKGFLFSGGRVYPENQPDDPALYLHWLWGSRRELIDPAKRMIDPVNNFLSNNFVLHRSDFNRVRFNTLLSGYGYEDTFFAYEISRMGLPIVHLRNPVMHTGLEPTPEFLGKIKESLINLIKLEKICAQRNLVFPVKSKLVRYYHLLRKPWIRPISRFISGISVPFLERHLSGKHPNLLALDLYRLTLLLKRS